ncbi:MAG: DUF1848 family protein [Sneathiella sp.]
MDTVTENGCPRSMIRCLLRFRSIKWQGNRAGCLCVASRDIGMYDTCAHGCVYCYSVSSAEKAKAALKKYKRGLATNS